MAIGANMTQREQLMVGIAVIALALAGAFWYFPYRAKNAQLARIEEHVESLDAVISRAQKEMAKGNVTELRAQAEQHRQNLALMRQLVPTNNEVPLLLDQVSTAARRANLDIGTVTPQPVLPGPEFDTYRYKIGLSGSFHELARFLANVGGLTRIVAPVDVKLSPATANLAGPRKTTTKALIQADLEIRTYVARSGPAPTGGARPAGGQ
jgi:type IV pilus assembly protein PilO